MILISEGEESLVDANLDELIQMGNNIIDRTDLDGYMRRNTDSS